MIKKTTPLAYSKVSITLHWIIALILIPMLSFSFFIKDLPHSTISTAFMIHKSLGLTILFLMFIRLYWILTRGKPSLPDSIPSIEQKAAISVHHALYLLVITMALCGWLMSVLSGRPPVYFGLFTLNIPFLPLNYEAAQWFNQAHKTIAWVLIALISLHVLAAFKHHFWDRNDILKRMWFMR